MTRSTVLPRRSALYMPASNGKLIDKARTLPCDAVIFDLEDAVAPDMKAAARATAAQAMAAGGFGDREVIIRVNGLDTPWGEADLAAAVAARPHAVLAPKISDAGDVLAYQRWIGDSGVDLWVMIETARALFNLADIAATASAAPLACFVMGTNDLAKETGARLTPGRLPMAGALGLAVAAARSAGLAILDGVYNDLEDAEGFAEECRQGRDFGFDGKTLIHPRQIDSCNQAFSPDEAEVIFARAVVAAFSSAESVGVGAIRVEGKMVERLHLAQCEQILAVAATLGAT